MSLINVDAPVIGQQKIINEFYTEFNGAEFEKQWLFGGIPKRKIMCVKTAISY